MEEAVPMMAHFLRETTDIFHVLKEINCQLQPLYPVEPTFREEGEIKTFSHEHCHCHT